MGSRSITPEFLMLRNSASPVGGTLPTGAFVNGADATGFATGARTPRDLIPFMGVATNIFLSFTSNPDTNPQAWGLGRWVSRPLRAPYSVNVNSLIQFTFAQGNSAHQANYYACGYIWRPSTGVQIGSVVEGTAGAIGSTSLQWSISVPVIASADRALVQDGDVYVLEISDRFTQQSAVAYTSTVYFDGQDPPTSPITSPASSVRFSAIVNGIRTGIAVQTAENISVAEMYSYPKSIARNRVAVYS
jgi:hypothetical protein